MCLFCLHAKIWLFELKHGFIASSHAELVDQAIVNVIGRREAGPPGRGLTAQDLFYREVRFKVLDMV